MTTIYVTEADISKKWPEIATRLKKMKKNKKDGRVLVVENSEPLYEIKPFEETLDQLPEMEYPDEEVEKWRKIDLATGKHLQIWKRQKKRLNNQLEFAI